MTEVMTDLYRTSDMALATFLRWENHDVQNVALDETGTCYWYFPDCDSLRDSCEAFRNGSARIEPKEYNRLFGVTKKERWALTDGHNRK
jgi:hypothetical protein